MQIIALYKIFSGNEFITSALEEIYSELDNFVFVSSEKDWNKSDRINTVEPVVREWKEKYDKENKIIILNSQATDQMEQYEEGYSYIRKNFNPDWLFISDSDEIWEKEVFKKAKEYLRRSAYYNNVRCSMKTYIKSPYFMVDPPEYNKPTCFIRPIFPKFPGVRGNHGKPSVLYSDIYFHHFSYVRKYEREVIEKIKTSFIGDQHCTFKCLPVDLDEWYKNKWHNLPYSKNFHTTKGYEKSWSSIKEITKEDLPESLRDKDILNNFNLKEEEDK